MDAAARTFPAVAGVVDGDAVAIGIVLVPPRNCRGSLFSPVVNVFAGFGAQECFFAGVLGDAHGGPALLAELAGDETFVLVESDYAELTISLELMPLDGLAAPAQFEIVLVLLTVLIGGDGAFGPLFFGKLLLGAPLGQLVTVLVELVVDLAWVFFCGAAALAAEDEAGIRWVAAGVHSEKVSKSFESLGRYGSCFTGLEGRE